MPWRDVVFTGAAAGERFSTYCETETFNASCPADHVIVMTHARYGRMQLGRCVKMDYGHIGCADDVIEAADWRCSGRRRCQVRVPDAELAKNKPCPDDLKPYLEAAYICVRGTTSTTTTVTSLAKVIWEEGRVAALSHTYAAKSHWL